MRKAKSDMRRLPYVLCPHCGKKAFARSSGIITGEYREVYYHCPDVMACGHVFVVALTAVRTVHPSMTPNPEVHLPITPANQLRRPMQATIVHAAT